MRVTSQLMVTNTLRRLSTRLEQYESKQEQLATGRRVNRTSDDPASASRAISLNAAIRARTQESRNATDALTYLDRSDAEMQQVLTSMHRVKDLTLRASSTIGPSEADAIARELEQLREGLVSMANATNGENPLFAGTADGLAVQEVAGVWTYTGDQGRISRRVSERERVVVNRTAEEVFGFGSAQGDVFTIIDDIVAGLNGSSSVPPGALQRLDDAFATVSEQLAVTGAATNRVESARDRTERSLLTLRADLAHTQDVDLEEAIMDLKVEEVAYEATLAALGRSLPQSLVAFLR